MVTRKMKDQTVKLHTAQKAKDRGFWWETFHFMKRMEDGTLQIDYGFSHAERTDDMINVPTQSLLAKWARDEFNKNIYAVKNRFGWVAVIIDCDNQDDFQYSRPEKTYEEAMEAGLNVFLDEMPVDSDQIW